MPLLTRQNVDAYDFRRLGSPRRRPRHWQESETTSSPPSAAEPVAGAHQAANSAAFVRTSNTRRGDAPMRTWFW
jgi:hypothetical protein